METLNLHNLTNIIGSPAKTTYKTKNVIGRQFAAGLILFLSDVAALTFSFLLSVFIKFLLFPGNFEFSKIVALAPLALCLIPFAILIRGFYPGFGTDTIEELRSITYLITIVYAVIGTATFFVKGQWDYSRAIFLFSWLISLAAVPLFRSLARKIFAKRQWWGIPVIIIGAGNAGEKVINSLKKHYHLGLRPVVAIDDDVDRWGYIHGVPVIGGLEIVPNLAKRLNITNAIIAMPSVSKKRLKEIIRSYSKIFDSLIVIPDLFGLTSLWVSSKVVGGILGMEIQKKLLKRTSYIKKRIFDIVLASVIGMVALPFSILISLFIWLDSKGSVFFHQERMGINNRNFNIVKFRTMHTDAEKRLHDLLSQDEDLRREYEVYHKMRNDPRLTRIGRFLRKFSLDELPQFLNVIKGEMSLIGPRAYLPWERKNMHGHDDIILKVKPGISGLWQVTDRNQSSFDDRLYIDVYYIRNWSMFLDIYIVAKTISVIFLGKGGY